MHALKARPWSVRLRLPDYGMGDIPVEQRSPSPEPIFDKNGQRVNSRVVLRRQKPKPKPNPNPKPKPKPKPNPNPNPNLVELGHRVGVR